MKDDPTPAMVRLKRQAMRIFSPNRYLRRSRGKSKNWKPMKNEVMMKFMAPYSMLPATGIRIVPKPSA